MTRPDRTGITAGGAIRLSRLASALVVLVADPVMWIIDRADFPTIGLAWWWAVQTAIAVGYGDVIPHGPWGRVVGALLMVGPTAWLAIVTAGATTSLVERARARRAPDRDTSTQLREALARLEWIEAILNRDRSEQK